MAPGLIQVIEQIPLPVGMDKWCCQRRRKCPLAALGLMSEPLPDRLLFLDTETTGLAGGTGTLPFMVCLARIQGEQLQLGQWILTGFSGEGALLETVAGWIRPSAHLVSYNGKSFDVPLLHAPGVAVGVAEEDEGAPREDLDLARVDAAAHEFGLGDLDVVDDELEAGDRTGADSVRPVPIEIEHAEPGGVSCTNRRSSVTSWSWSRVKPTWSA